MLNEIINKFENFSDALVSEIKYNYALDRKDAEVTIKCMNRLNDYNWEIIKLFFIDVVYFRFYENDKTTSTIINSALLKNENDLIIIDFFPLIFGGSNLKINENSDFIIYCKRIEYTSIE